ncbi:bifunctional (p)ppGpp synthetase/guanosine-3',5'-bis(diphosphate) 3'-pyrophosphohydrolase [Patescibacteria group bacterium]|nr:bifunctional (p)ppGpp synthetase/guanosine-3',5'-bis(diphosphate) 3'-pyrophosphohydrolase [Patescibacteria group bacterium]
MHTNVGLTFKNALVNREIKPINYIPKTGDVVMIQTWKNKYTANKSRLEYLHTPSAKANLNRYIKNKEKDETLKHIIAELNKKLKELNLPMFRTQEDKIHKLYDNAEIEKKLMEVSDKKSNINRIIKSAYPEEHGQIVVKAKKTIQILDSAIIDGNQLLNYELCPECKPTIEDKIIAKSGRHGIKIHAMRCKALKTVNYAHLLETHRL